MADYDNGFEILSKPDTVGGNASDAMAREVESSTANQSRTDRSSMQPNFPGVLPELGLHNPSAPGGGDSAAEGEGKPQQRSVASQEHSQQLKREFEARSNELERLERNLKNPPALGGKHPGGYDTRPILARIAELKAQQAFGPMVSDSDYQRFVLEGDAKAQAALRRGAPITGVPITEASRPAMLKPELSALPPGLKADAVRASSKPSGEIAGEPTATKASSRSALKVFGGLAIVGAGIGVIVEAAKGKSDGTLPKAADKPPSVGKK